MTEMEIAKLIERAKKNSTNSFIPFSEQAIGAVALSNENVLYGGCALDTHATNFGASTVAILKAVSEGATEFKIVCIYQEGFKLPVVRGFDRDIIEQFGKKALIILAHDGGFEKYSIREFLPLSSTTLEDS